MKAIFPWVALIYRFDLHGIVSQRVENIQINVLDGIY